MGKNNNEEKRNDNYGKENSHINNYIKKGLVAVLVSLSFTGPYFYPQNIQAQESELGKGNDLKTTILNKISKLSEMLKGSRDINEIIVLIDSIRTDLSVNNMKDNKLRSEIRITFEKELAKIADFINVYLDELIRNEENDKTRTTNISPGNRILNTKEESIRELIENGLYSSGNTEDSISTSPTKLQTARIYYLSSFYGSSNRKEYEGKMEKVKSMDMENDRNRIIAQWNSMERLLNEGYREILSNSLTVKAKGSIPPADIDKLYLIIRYFNEARATGNYSIYKIDISEDEYKKTRKRLYNEWWRELTKQLSAGMFENKNFLPEFRKTNNLYSIYCGEKYLQGIGNNTYLMENPQFDINRLIRKIQRYGKQQLRNELSKINSFEKESSLEEGGGRQAISEVFTIQYFFEQQGIYDETKKALEDSKSRLYRFLSDNPFISKDLSKIKSEFNGQVNGIKGIDTYIAAVYFQLKEGIEPTGLLNKKTIDKMKEKIG